MVIAAKDLVQHLAVAVDLEELEETLFLLAHRRHKAQLVQVT